MSHRNDVMTAVRIAITCFILILLTVVTLGWRWTNSHQPPPLKMASHVVLSLAALAGIFAIAKIWRTDPPAGSGRS